MDKNIKIYKNTVHMKLGYYFILLHQKTKSKNSAEVSNSYVIICPLVKTPGRPLSLLKLYKMAHVENVEAQNLGYQKVEELFEDRDLEVFDTILLNGPIDTIKKKLKLLKHQGTDIHNVYQYYLHFFTSHQSPNFS